MDRSLDGLQNWAVTVLVEKGIRPVPRIESQPSALSHTTA